MFKKLKEQLKMFKGIKGFICMKCDNCNSIDLVLDRDSLKEEVVPCKGGTLKKVEYIVNCNKCGSVARIEEYWEVDDK